MELFQTLATNIVMKPLISAMLFISQLVGDNLLFMMIVVSLIITIPYLYPAFLRAKRLKTEQECRAKINQRYATRTSKNARFESYANRIEKDYPPLDKPEQHLFYTMTSHILPIPLLLMLITFLATGHNDPTKIIENIDPYLFSALLPGSLYFPLNSTVFGFDLLTFQTMPILPMVTIILFAIMLKITTIPNRRPEPYKTFNMTLFIYSLAISLVLSYLRPALCIYLITHSLTLIALSFATNGSQVVLNSLTPNQNRVTLQSLDPASATPQAPPPEVQAKRARGRQAQRQNQRQKPQKPRRSRR